MLDTVRRMTDPRTSRLASTIRPVWKRLPASVRGARVLRPLRKRVAGGRVVSTLAELDRELERLDSSAYDEEKAIFAGFRMEAHRGDHLDPASPEYRLREVKLYEWIAGKPYAPSNDITRFDVDAATRRPFPYYTKSARGVGDQLIAIGFVIKMLDLPAGSSVLEFGPGWGTLTVALARMGYDVTAVDIAPDFLELVRRRAAQEDCDIKLIEGDFEIVTTLERTFDAVVFFESFHHCFDHRALIARLKDVTKRVIFAGEPITNEFDEPWGIRLDGESLWAMRRNGWFECGFREDYFVGLLEGEGWHVTKHHCKDTPAGVVFVATR